MAKYIYLDSNAFWLMKRDHADFNPEFLRIVQKLGTRYKFPFSSAHLRDIALGDKPGKSEYVENDLRLLMQLSKGDAVDLDMAMDMPTSHVSPIANPISGGEGPWITQGRIDNIIPEYQKIRAHDYDKSSQRVSSDFQGESYSVDMAQIPDGHPMKAHLARNGGILSPKVFSDFLDEIKAKIGDPDYYKNLRKFIVRANNGIGKKNTLLGREGGDPYLPIKDFSLAKTEEEASRLIVDGARALASIKEEEFDDYPWQRKISSAYTLLDFNQYFHDKINNGNQPINMRIDTDHLIYAAGASHLVTNDATFEKKARVIYLAFGITTKVSGIRSFLAKFC